MVNHALGTARRRADDAFEPLFGARRGSVQGSDENPCGPPAGWDLLEAATQLHDTLEADRVYTPDVEWLAAHATRRARACGLGIDLVSTESEPLGRACFDLLSPNGDSVGLLVCAQPDVLSPWRYDISVRLRSLLDCGTQSGRDLP